MRVRPGWSESEQDTMELKEIAHLYFSEKRCDDAPDSAERAGRVTHPVSAVSPSLLVHFVEDPTLPEGLSLFFLSNLAVIMWIRGVPVILVGSCTRLNGNSFVCLGGNDTMSLDAAGAQPRDKFLGPLGIPVFGVTDGTTEHALIQGPGHAEGEGFVETMRHERAGFVLAQQRRWFVDHAVPSSRVIFPVHPESDERCFSEICSLEKGSGRGPCAGWGIMVVGVSSQEEAETLHRIWAERIRNRFRRAARYYGFLPGDLSPEIDSRLWSPYVLREPLTVLTRCFVGIASVLLKERDGLLAEPPPSSSPCPEGRVRNQTE